MQRNPVSFAIQHDGPPTMRTDLLNGLQDLASELERRSNRISQPTLHIEVDQRTRFRRRVVLASDVDATGDVVTRVGQEAKRESWPTLSRHLAPKNLGIELDCPVEIRRWNIDPNESMAHDIAPELLPNVFGSQSTAAPNPTSTTMQVSGAWSGVQRNVDCTKKCRSRLA